jgi:hypothetical protein
VLPLERTVDLAQLAAREAERDLAAGQVLLDGGLGDHARRPHRTLTGLPLDDALDEHGQRHPEGGERDEAQQAEAGEQGESPAAKHGTLIGARRPRL